LGYREDSKTRNKEYPPEDVVGGGGGSLKCTSRWNKTLVGGLAEAQKGGNPQNKGAVVMVFGQTPLFWGGGERGGEINSTERASKGCHKFVLVGQEAFRKDEEGDCKDKFQVLLEWANIKQGKPNESKPQTGGGREGKLLVQQKRGGLILVKVVQKCPRGSFSGGKRHGWGV